jgi:hypothetical protein
MEKHGGQNGHVHLKGDLSSAYCERGDFGTIVVIDLSLTH